MEAFGNTAEVVGLLNGLTASQIQTITSGTTATIGAGIRLVLVNTTAGNFTLTRGALVVGHETILVKTSTDANSITLARAGAETINGAAANLALPGSTSTVGYVAWLSVDVSGTAVVVV